MEGPLTLKDIPKPAGRYHHGELREAALRRGRALVEQHGPEALTVRGLARELNVTPPAILYHFGTRVRLRAAVAERVQEELAKTSGVASAGERAVAIAQEAGRAWIDFASANPNLYRVAFGEGWRGKSRVGQRWSSGGTALPSPSDAFTRRMTRVLERGCRSGHVAIDEPRHLASHLAAGVHGLALARIDGLPEPVVEQALVRLVQGIPRGPRASALPTARAP